MRKILTVLAVLAIYLCFSPLLHAQAPVIFFTDIDSGPNTGNTDTTFNASGNGAYVTIYGNFFGSSQGSSTVTWNGNNCLSVLPSTGGYTGWGMAHLWYQKIIVQVLSTCPTGTGQFTVTVNGKPSTCAANPSDPWSCNFTVRALGSNHIYFAETNGNDGAAGTWTAPLASPRGCKNKIVAGDICYLGGGTSQTNGEAFSIIILTSASGTAGSPIAFGSYPGATPQPYIGCKSSQSGCAFNGAMQFGMGNRNVGNLMSYWTIFGINFHQESGSTALMMWQGTGAIDGNTHNRVIGNYFTCPNFNDVQGCFQTQEVVYIDWLGNELTGSGVPAPTYSQKQSHGVYFSSDTNHVWMGFNSVHDNTTCRGMQAHSSPLGGGGTGDPTGYQQYDIHVFNNLFYNEPCAGVNLATVDASKGTVELYNNVIFHVGFHTSSDGGGDFTCLTTSQGFVNDGPGSAKVPPIQIYNNSCHDAGSVTNDCCGARGAYGDVSAPDAWMANNVADQLPGEIYLPTSKSSGMAGGTNNNWNGVGAGPSSGFSGNLSINPLLVSSTNLHLQSTSPMIGAGVASWSGDSGSGRAPTYDFDGRVRPNPPSIGAYEYTSGSVAAPQPPTNLTVTVQ